MAKRDHFERLKLGVYYWNKWRKENPDVIPDLEGAMLDGANLSEADLSKANLGKAYLRKARLDGAKLIEANLSGAYLIKADLIEVNLSQANLREANLIEANLNKANLNKANLNKANLRGVNLSETSLKSAILTDTELHGATLIGANLSESDISGANLNNANLSKWVIKGIRCSHIFWNGKELKFKEGEFEKVFTAIENTIDIIIDLPFSEICYHTGRIIEEVANQKFGEDSILFKGQTAISDDNTKMEFISFSISEEFEEIKAKLNKIPIEIENRIITKVKNEKAEQDDRNLIRFKDEFELPLTKGLVKVSSKEMARRMNERYITMHPILQKIVIAVQAAIQ